MEFRKNKHILDIIDYIKSKWQLSINEFSTIESILNLFLAQKIEEIEKIEYLINDETENLLLLLDRSRLKFFAEDVLGMIEEEDVEECDEYKDLNDYDDDDLLSECDRRGLKWDEEKSKLDIVTQSDLEEMTELFLELSPQKRSEIINSLKNDKI